LLIEEDDPSGSTAVVAIYDGRKKILTVAGVGDSLCVLSRSGKVVEMNKIHRLDNISERDRVKNAGGTIINNRVNGVLAVSRAFGDTQFKTLSDAASSTSGPAKVLPLHKQVQGSLLTAIPDIYSEVITPKTEFALIACDGLWDIMSPQIAVKYVRQRLFTEKDVGKVAR
jgi:serine/threonine protein phosphatase PrpC